MDQKNLDELLKRLDALSEKIGIAGAHLWPQAVRYEIAESIVSIIVSLIVIPILAWLAIKAYKTELDCNYDAVAKGLALICCACGMVIAFTWLNYSIPVLISPEWAAFKSLVNTKK